MPDLEHNQAVWSTEWDWSQGGDEWSVQWGGTDALWHGALLPRIHAWLPTEGTILEIAPGYGRWTQYLKDLCDHLVIVDLTERCIEACRARFAGPSNIEYHVNDGRSLDMVADHSVDFAFSFDSLVHAEADVLEAYVSQLARKLKPDGVAFLHHSNARSYRRFSQLSKKAPPKVMRRLVDAGVLLDVYAWRSETVSADLVAAQCERAGLSCFAQEKISWQHGRFMIDGLSLFTPKGSRWERPRRVVRNPFFVDEARRMARLYSAAAAHETRD
jgi:SAM-dependent methyltransferase